jgi:hypothetical protein
LIGHPEAPPTVVLVDSLVADLALFWDLRLAAENDLPVWVIPVPAESAGDPAMMAQLRAWILSFEAYHRRSNFCRVTSSSVPHAALKDFAARLQRELEGTHLAQVDPWVPTNRLPVVIPFESEKQIPVELTGQTLRFHPPTPQLLERGLAGAWMVDLVEDVRRKRAISELCLPPRISAFAVLNAPRPLSVSLARIPRMGDGIDGINVRSTERQGVVTVHLPTDAEVLEEVLRESGFQPTEDEKRACYLPVMKMFGGLADAAKAFSAQRSSILRVLTQGTMRISDILGRARLGRGRLQELAQPRLPEEYLRQLDPVSRRILDRRSREEWCRVSPASTELESLMEFWADREVVSRQWRLGPCPACLGVFWEPRIDISRPVPCPGCGMRLRLPPQVPIGYALHRLVGHAIRQGIIPVVLTGRFLKALTSEGYLWLPGVKFKWKDEDGDLDILACCDGYIVVAECKSLEEGAPGADVWDEILGQFGKAVEVGKACGAALAVLAVMADSFPSGFQERVNALAGSSLTCLLLGRQDLETGYRQVAQADNRRSHNLAIYDLLLDPMPELPRAQPEVPRRVFKRFGSITY